MTGVTSALGRTLLRRLWVESAWAGVRFLLVGRDKDALAGLAREALAAGREAEILVADFSLPGAGRVLASAVQEAGARGPWKGLALLAGAAEDAPLARLEEAAWDRVWSVNCGVHAAILRALHPQGLLAPDARGLLIGSLSGSRGNAGQTAYAAAKGALADLLPLAPSALRLNVLLPPLLPSPMTAALSPQARERLYQARLLDDPDPAASCADAAAFLLSDAAAYLHRQCIHADSRVTALGWD